MPIPIKDTPVLFGADAIKFLKAIQENTNKAISQEELKRIQTNYKIMQLLIERSIQKKQQQHESH